jgi:hypothetical protein
MKSLRFNWARKVITLQRTSGTSRYGPKPEPSSGEADSVIRNPTLHIQKMNNPWSTMMYISGLALVPMDMRLTRLEQLYTT